MVSVAGTNTVTKSNFQERMICLTHKASLLLREARAENQGRKLETGTQKKAAYWLDPDGLLNYQVQLPKVAPPTVGCSLLHQLEIKKMPDR